MKQSSLKPTNKVTAGGVGGAGAVVVIYIMSLLGVALTPEVASAITVLVSFVLSYLVKEKS